jgi:hypothetical protein
MIPEEKPRLRDRFAAAIDRSLEVAINIAGGGDWKAALAVTLCLMLILAGFAGLVWWFDVLDSAR